MTPKQLEKEFSRIIDGTKTDPELIALRRLFKKLDKAAAVKLASTSMDPKVLCDLAPFIGPSHPKAYEIAEKRLKELFPEEYRQRQITRDVLLHPRGLPVG